MWLHFQIADKPIAKARVYATARGIYDLYINGSRINSSYFSPGSTQYNKTHRYQIYDITELLYKGPNAIGVQLAEGWWSGGATFMGENWNVFGDRQSIYAACGSIDPRFGYWLVGNLKCVSQHRHTTFGQLPECHAAVLAS